MNLDQWIALLAAVGQITAAFLALAALFISIRTSRAQIEMSERLAREQSAGREREAREQAALLFEQVRMQRDSDILRWTERCIESLSDADTFCDGLIAQPFDALQSLKQDTLLARLSALIDQGRLYFPNQTPEKQGPTKPAAYQGFRQRILSVLVRAYDVILKVDTATTGDAARVLCSRLINLRRTFVSEAQVAIDPRRFIALREMNSIRVELGLKTQTQEETEWADANGNSDIRSDVRVGAKPANR
jgi:hypothetical protein